MKLKKLLKKLYLNSFISIGNGDNSTGVISVSEFFNYFYKNNTDILRLKVKSICTSKYYDSNDQNGFDFKFNFISITLKTDIETISYIAKIIKSISEHDTFLLALKK